MWRLAFFAGALWFGSGLILTLIAVSRWVFDPERSVALGGLTRREAFGHRLAAAWLWPIYLFSKSGRQMIMFIFNDEEGI